MHVVILSIGGIIIKLCSEITGLMLHVKSDYKDHVLSEEPCSCDTELHIVLTGTNTARNTSGNNSDNGILYKEARVGYHIKYMADFRFAEMRCDVINAVYENFERVILFLLSNVCINSNKLLLHCSALRNELNQVFLFFGPSKIGKSTIAKKLTSLQLISDDLVVLERDDQQHTIFKTPFDRNTIANSRQKMPCQIAGIYRLLQEDETKRERLTSVQAILLLAGNVWMLDYSTESYHRMLPLLHRLIKGVPVYSLSTRFTDSGKDILQILNLQYERRYNRV